MGKKGGGAGAKGGSGVAGGPGAKGGPGAGGGDGAGAGRTVVVGVTGSIAAFRAAEVCSALRKEGCDVRVVMTRWARQFVGELTFTTLTARPVITDDNLGDYADRPEHLALGDVADLYLVAPATANILAKMAHGVADDIVSTTYLSVTCPVLVAPAMNVRMWEHVVVRENVAALKRRGVTVIEPDEGLLACGDFGKGRLAATPTILAAVHGVLASAVRRRQE
jgi:phosphopantothenoylcysteine decarboxylase/phosphopantothenate--cysteine ligase